MGNVPIRDKGKWTYFRKFDKCTTYNTKTVQIHYDSSHFIVSAKLPGDPIVYLLDSSNSSKLSEGIRLQLSSQYGKPRENLEIIQCRTQQQRPHLGNCGLFSIANALDFCDNNRVTQADIDLDEYMLRPHLIECFESMDFKLFPKMNKVQRRMILKKKISHTINISCKCGISDEFEDMVMCDKASCGKWYHYSCGNSIGTPKLKTWICPDCKN